MDTGCAFASLRSAAPLYGSLQALSDTPFGCVHCPAASAPLRTLMRAAGPEARKTLCDRENSIG
jgi:hypothetical protein